MISRKGWQHQTVRLKVRYIFPLDFKYICKKLDWDCLIPRSFPTLLKSSSAIQGNIYQFTKLKLARTVSWLKKKRTLQIYIDLQTQSNFQFVERGVSHFCVLYPPKIPFHQSSIDLTTYNLFTLCPLLHKRDSYPWHHLWSQLSIINKSN